MSKVKILSGATVITVNKDREIIQNGAVAIDGKKIAAVGKAADIVEQYPDAKVIDARGQMIVPGFINLHVHCAINVIRGIGDDMGGAPIYRKDIPQGVMLSPDDAYVMTRLGAMQAMALGSTTIVENYIHSLSNVRALAEVGIRAVVSERIHDADLFSVRGGSGSYTYDKKHGHELLKTNEKLISKWQNYDDGRIQCWVGPHGPDTVSEDLLKASRKLADEAGVGLSIHLAQNQREVDQVRHLKDRTSVQYLADCGVLGEDLIAGHCAFLEPGDAELIAQSGTTVCHLPTVNAKSGWIAPIPQLRDLGAHIGLGSDNMVHDMIDTMRFALCVDRVKEGNTAFVKAMDVLEQATINGAKAIGREHELGSIEQGKIADLLLIDVDNRINLAPVMDHVANIVYAGQAADIHSVMIGGSFVVRNRQILPLPSDKVIQEAQQRAEKLWREIADWKPYDGPMRRVEAQTQTMCG